MTPPVSAAPVLSRYRWTICALLFSATTINYMDRQILGILAPVLQTDIGWNEMQYGHIVTAFQLAYALGLGLMGRFVDVIGTKRGYSVAIVIWSLAAMGHAAVHSVFGFGLARFGLGFGEAGNFPAAIKTVAEWFPKKERALATGIFNSGANIGAVLAPLAVPWITLHYGWRAAFLCLGALGFGWILFWLLFYETPERCGRIGPVDRVLLRVGDDAPVVEKVSWRWLFAQRQTWAYIVATAIVSPVWWFFLYWLPKFLHQQHGLDLAHLGAPLMVVYTGACIGSVGGGWIPAQLLKRGRTPNFSRKMALLICALAALPVIFAPLVVNLWLAVGLMALAAAANQGYFANLYTTVSDLFPKQAVASVVGLGGMFGSLFAALFAEVAGYVLQHTGRYQGLFLFCGSAFLLSVLLFHLLSPRLRPVAMT